MAIRQIRTIGDEILTKECKPVKEMNERTIELIEDMFETMYENNGCGLAAPQVGVRKRIVVIDVDDGNQYVDQPGDPRDQRKPDRSGGMLKRSRKMRSGNTRGARKGKSAQRKYGRV